MDGLRCEMCGNTNLIKKDEYLVCSACGVKYFNDSNNPIIGSFIYCPNCGTKNRKIDTFCKNCGIRLDLEDEVSRESKNMILALLLSFILPGFGLIYVGRVKRGILEFCIVFLSSMFIPVIWFLLWIVQLFDTYYAVKQINTGEKPLFIGRYDLGGNW